MDSRNSRKKRKIVSSKLTKLSLKKNTQELKGPEDSFDDFGSFALSLQSSKEIDGTTSSSGEEKSYFLNRNTYSVNIIDLLPSGNEVRDSPQLQTQPSQSNFLLESSLRCKTSFELSDVKRLKDSTCDSDESFAENFETPNKVKHCPDKSCGHEEIRSQEFSFSDVSLVPKEENDNIICLNSSQTVSDNSSKSNNCCIETDRSLPVLSSLDTPAVDCVTTEGGTDHICETVNRIIPNSVSEEKQSENLSVNDSKQQPKSVHVLKSEVSISQIENLDVHVIDSKQKQESGYVLKSEVPTSLLETVDVHVLDTKQKQESVHVQKSEVTISPAEDVDVRVPQDKTSRDAENVCDADDDQLSPYFSASELTCPLCWKKFEKKNIQTSHMKSCAASHNVTTKQLIKALALQSKQAAERKALGLPETPVTAAQVSTRKNVSRKGTGVPKDQNLQLALALSVSMKEAEQLELEKEEDALIEAGLGEEVMERQKSLLEKFGFTSSKLPSLDAASPRAGPKKGTFSVPVLMTRSKEERERLITEKVAIILMGKEDETGTCQTSENSSTSKCRQQRLSSKYLHKFLNKENYLWRKAQEPPEGIHRNSYYVNNLDTFITPSTVVTGSQLKDISMIPCREKTPVRDSLRETDANKEDFIKQSDFKPVQYIPEGPHDSLDKQDETHSLDKQEEIHTLSDGDDDEKKDISMISSPSSLTASCLSLGKDRVLKNWKMQINNKTMSDVTIHVKGNLDIAAHKTVFFAQAPSIFNDILEKAGEQVGHLHWKDVSFSSALAFLHYVYCGSVEEIYSLREDLSDIQSLAVKYKMSELSDHLDKLQNLNNSALTGLRDECLNNRMEEKYSSNKANRTNRVPDTFQSHSKLDVEDTTDTLQQQNVQHCNEIDSCQDSATSNFFDIDPTDYSSDTRKFEKIVRESQFNQHDNKSGRSSPDIFSEPNTPDKTNDTQRDNIDILSSMLCKITSGHELTNIDNTITDVHEDTNSVCDLTQGSPEHYLNPDYEPTKIVELADDSSIDVHEDANIPCNLTPKTPEECHSVSFSGMLTAKAASAKRKLTDAILTPSKCESPAKKNCKEWDSSPLQLESKNQNLVLSIPTDSVVDTIDLTQNSDGSHENETHQQNCTESTNVQKKSPLDREAVEMEASEVHSFEIEESDKNQYNMKNCCEESNQGGEAYCSDDYNTIPEQYENTFLADSPLESCRTEESPEYGITTFASPNSPLKSINKITEETRTNSPFSETPLALRCLSHFSDGTMRHSLSQIMSHLVDKDTQSLILAHNEGECKQISPSVTSTHSSGTPKTLKETAIDSLKMMLEDSFVEQIQDSSFFREELKNSPSGSYRTATNANINDDNSENLEHQSVTPGNKSGVSEELTPLPDYSTMKTPQLKKELQKYGLKPLKRKQAKLILRHIYNELHPLIPVNGSSTTQAISTPSSSLVTEDRKGRENVAKHKKSSDSLVPTKRSPRKRNILKSFSDSSKACSSYNKENSEDESDSGMFFESSCNAKDYSILVDDVEVFHEQDATNENGSECSQEVDLQTAVQNFIINNPEIHEKILTYEPVWLNDLKDGLKANKIKFKLNDLMDYLDEQCITYRTAAGPHKSRQRRKGVTTSQSQNVTRKKRTTEEDNYPLPSSAY